MSRLYKICTAAFFLLAATACSSVSVQDYAGLEPRFVVAGKVTVAFETLAMEHQFHPAPLLRQLAECDREIAAKLAALGERASRASTVRLALVETEDALREGEAQLERIVAQASAA